MNGNSKADSNNWSFIDGCYPNGILQLRVNVTNEHKNERYTRPFTHHTQRTLT